MLILMIVLLYYYGEMDYLYSIANKLSFSYLMYNAIYHFWLIV